ncbi:unnamed protein product [Adineta steineri]|uniref:Peptidylamidoglycolate lyase n=1 Tax=Adineta steineri TaxID=433720 RepID=A0A819SU07_9BILA|nr:unnamed protein product [Adineta steineri]
MKRFRIDTIIVHSILIILLTFINYGESTSVHADTDDFFTVNITMTNMITTKEDEYAYVQYKLPDEELWIVGYSPLTEMNTVHHMLTYACASPGSDKAFWIGAGSCRGENTLIHGWARNAPPLTLPKDVGFAVGRNTPYKYIVANLHYLAIVAGDNSGNQITLSRKPRKYRAGVMLGATGSIQLPPKTHTIRTPFSCLYNGPPISIFAIRVHAHDWARVNSLYRVRNGNISQIVKSNPQWAQSFYPLPSSVQIEKGDFFVGQCVYDNDDDRTISAGSTHHDEMCNVYAMYSYEPSATPTGTPPISGCWGDAVTAMSRLMPPDSVIAPASPADIGGTNNDKILTKHILEASNGNVYKSVHHWPNVQSLPKELGQVGGIALNNANDELVVFHRGSRKWEFYYFDGVRFRDEKYGSIEENVLVHIDAQTGESKSQWGAKMFYMPHGLTIDHDGNFWLTDIALHQVFMFKPNNLTHPVLTIGERFKSGSGNNQFCRPADIAVMRNGDFFVADGYCNNRVIKFNRQGQYIMQWGLPMTGKYDNDGYPLPNEWNIVHSIALNEGAQLLCAADRENFRIQCFHPYSGQFLRQIHVEKKGTNGAIYAIEFASNTNEPILFAVTGGAQTSAKKIYIINAETGDVLKALERNVLLNSPHDITVSKNANEIYIGELASSPGDALRKYESLTTLVQESNTSAHTSHELSAPKNKESKKLSILYRLSPYRKQIRIALVVFIAILIPAYTIFVIYCLLQVRNRRKRRPLDLYTSDVKNSPTNSSSLFSKWINRPKSFKGLEQAIEEENQLLNSDEENQLSNSNEDVIFKTKHNNPAILQMTDSA